MDDRDLQHLAFLLLQLHVEVARRDRRIADLEKELGDLRRLHEPQDEEKGKEN